jgi:hypothetical protein
VLGGTGAGPGVHVTTPLPTDPTEGTTVDAFGQQYTRPDPGDSNGRYLPDLPDGTQTACELAYSGIAQPGDVALTVTNGRSPGRGRTAAGTDRQGPGGGGSGGEH